MTSVLLAMGAMLAVGLPVTLALDRGVRGPMLFGLAYLYGSGVVFVVMLLLAIVGVRWTPLSIAVPLISIAAGAGWLARRRGAHERIPIARDAESARGVAYAVDFVTALAIAGYALFCTLAPPWEWDFWAIWGLKGRVFFELRTIDWRQLESVSNRFAHPDYPLLLPLNYAFTAVVGGAWNDRWLGLLFAGYATAAILVVRELAQRESSRVVAAAIAFGVAFEALSLRVGMAEGPLIAFAGCGVLLMRAALLTDNPAAARHAALLLGLAASVKNEGFALLGAVALTLAAMRPRLLPRLWPAVVLAAPWVVLRTLHVPLPAAANRSC